MTTSRKVTIAVAAVAVTGLTLMILGSKTLHVGQPAPEFDTQTHTGQRVRLSDYRGRQAVVVFFYPKDGTAVCTREACAFRDAYEDFAAAGAVVIGISGDTVESHQQFVGTHQLPFLLIADTDGSLRRQFGVRPLLGLVPGRVTFVIDRDGIIQHTFSGMLQSDRHVQEALAVVRRLAAEHPPGSGIPADQH